jgi:hypothetical protein
LTTTILRGKVVVEDGRLSAEPTGGQRLARTVAEPILRGPAW